MDPVHRESGRINYATVCLEDYSGQIIATSHDLTPNGGSKGNHRLFQGNLGW